MSADRGVARRPGCVEWFFRAMLGAIPTGVGFILFAILVDSIMEGRHEGAFYVRAAAIGLMVLAVALAPLSYFGLRVERAENRRAGRPAEVDRSWWTAVPVLVALGAAVLAVERAIAYGVSGWFAAAGVLLILAAVWSVAGLGAHYQARRRRAEGKPVSLLDRLAPPLMMAWLGGTIAVVQQGTRLGVNGWLTLGCWLGVSLVGALMIGERERKRDRKREHPPPST